MDNWFTSIPLASEMLQAPYKLTVVGTLRHNKVGILMFCFNIDITMLSYKPKSNKVVHLVSTTHNQPSINTSTKNPEINLFIFLQKAMWILWIKWAVMNE